MTTIIAPRTLLFTALAALCALAGAAGCATDVSAETHREKAAREEAQAAAHRARYDESARAVGLEPTLDGRAVTAQEYNPTHWEQEAADAHSRAAERHRAAARALEESEDAACVDVPKAARNACPLLSPTVVADVAGGVRVTFADVAAADRAAAVIRCQQAFAVARGFEDMPTCALYARGLKLTQEGATVTLTSTDGAAVARLRENVRGHHES